MARNSPRLPVINLWPSDSRSIWNLEMLVFEERGKLEYPEKNLSGQGREPTTTQPTFDAESRNRTRATLVGGLRGRQMLNHCAIPAPQLPPGQNHKHCAIPAPQLPPGQNHKHCAIPAPQLPPGQNHKH